MKGVNVCTVLLIIREKKCNGWCVYNDEEFQLEFLFFLAFSAMLRLSRD